MIRYFFFFLFIKGLMHIANKLGSCNFMLLGVKTKPFWIWKFRKMKRFWTSVSILKVFVFWPFVVVFWLLFLFLFWGGVVAFLFLFLFVVIIVLRVRWGNSSYFFLYLFFQEYEILWVLNSFFIWDVYFWLHLNLHSF